MNYKTVAYTSHTQAVSATDRCMFEMAFAHRKHASVRFEPFLTCHQGIA